jgi:hypothetical protein
MMSLKTSLKFAGAALAACLSFAGCGPDYAVFKVHVTAPTAPRNDIATCLMSITDTSRPGPDNVVLRDYPLQRLYGHDGEGNLKLSQGCEAERITGSEIGIFSYSTSRSSGAFVFTVDAYNDEVNHDDEHKIETKSSDPIQIKAYPPEIGVELALARLAGK